MADVKHTRGPWTHAGQGDITGVENDPKNGCIGPVDVCCVYLRTVKGRSEANARLIAAAPDLLEALVAAETVLRYLPDINTNWVGERATMTTRRAEAIVIAAIAKATGAARATEGSAT